MATTPHYSACGIPYFIGGDVDDVEALIARTPEQFLRDHAIEARLRREVTAIDMLHGHWLRAGTDDLVRSTIVFGTASCWPRLPAPPWTT